MVNNVKYAGNGKTQAKAPRATPREGMGPVPTPNATQRGTKARVPARRGAPDTGIREGGPVQDRQPVHHPQQDGEQGKPNKHPAGERGRQAQAGIQHHRGRQGTPEEWPPVHAPPQKVLGRDGGILPATLPRARD